MQFPIPVDFLKDLCDSADTLRNVCKSSTESNNVTYINGLPLFQGQQCFVHFEGEARLILYHLSWQQCGVPGVEPCPWCHVLKVQLPLVHDLVVMQQLRE